ncbi:MAG: hypothetical protein H6Q90_1136 [Deltaproteobacteria bacterium]|nr:hypothetical protein [Deltaproteobacteria bacterium]
MIPYDDLVVALTTWRAKQGLPVAAHAAPAPVPAAQALPSAAGSASGPRTAPPSPRGRVGTPPPLAAFDPADEALDVDEGALIEESHYENEGDDFAMAFDARNQHEAESTAIGTPPAPSRDSFGGPTMLDPDLEPESSPPPKRRGHDDW